MVFENYVPQVSYVIASIILTLSGDTITKDFVIPKIKNFVKDTSKEFPIWGMILGTILFILWCSLGVWVISKLLESNFINKNNVDFISAIGFLILMFFLNVKYKMDW